MDKVVSMEKYLEDKLAMHHAAMMRLIAEARDTIDEAVERNDFNLLVKAYHLTDQAVKENDKIRLLKRYLHIDKPKVNVDIKQNNH
jgi:hypothetical protein